MNVFWMIMAAYGLVLMWGLLLLGYCAWVDRRGRDDQS